MTHVEPSPQPAPSRPAGSFPNAWTLFAVRGIPVRLDRSWLLIAAVVTFLFYGRMRVALPHLGMVEVILLSALCAVLFFASILAHELGHALTSLDRDIPVIAITLFALGGVTESAHEARRARDEFIIVGIGPFISLVLAGVFGLLHTAALGNETLAAVPGYLAWLNLALAVFNIIPGYPLDGGRLLRSVLWAATGRPHRSTRWAARVGQVFAGAVIVSGLTGFATGGGAGFGGLWEVFIGFFLFQGATSSHKRARLRESLEQVTVRQLMGSVPLPLSPDWPLSQALPLMQERPSLLWPVGDPVTGTLLLKHVDAVPSERWETTRVGDIAHPPQTSTVRSDAPVDEVLDMLSDAPDNMLVVVEEDGRPVGLLTPSLMAGPVS